MTFIGLDPGKTGGIAALYPGLTPVAQPMPVIGKELDLGAVVKWLYPAGGNSIDFAVVERQQAMPKQGVASTFQTGYGFGVLVGLLYACNTPFQIVSAKEWQKTFGITGARGDVKTQAAQIAQRLFPEVELRATARCRKPHEGIVDALLIAEYARRLRAGQQAAA